MESPLSWMKGWVGIPAFIITVAGIFLMYSQYFAAEILVCIAGGWTIIAWQFSDFLQKGEKEIARLKRRAEKPTANRSTRDAYDTRQSYYYRWERLVSIFVGLITIGSVLAIAYEGNKYDLSLREGTLYPANEPVPPINCSLVKDTAFLLFLGSNGIAFTEVFPRPVIRVRDEDVLTIDKNGDGSLAVSAIIKDRDGRILTEIKRGKFVVAQGERIFKKERLSRSELKVTDEYGNVVLNVKFFNPRAMWITFKSHGFEVRGSKLQNNQSCFGGHGGANQPMIWMFPPPPQKLKQALEVPRSDE